MKCPYCEREIFGKNVPGFKYWGGRGITICERWRDFKNFLEDMGPKPKGLTLTWKEQMNNHRPKKRKEVRASL